VWQDYENKVINPELMEKIDMEEIKIYSSCGSNKCKNGIVYG